MKTLKSFTIPTPLGDLQVMMSESAIVLCEFSDHQARITKHLAKHHAGAKIVDIKAPKQISAAFENYFSGNVDALNALAFSPSGTAHELKIWHYLRTVPAGTTQSYGEMAKNLNSSPRAVGGANGRNAIALIIPCHRIIGADGTLTGYAGGLERKQWLLRHEGAL